jgi:hypothetical protein
MYTTDDICHLHQEILLSSKIILDIIKELCSRDSRFQFLKESMSEFLNGDEGSKLLQSLFGLIKHEQKFDKGPETLESLQKIWQTHYSAHLTLRDITCSAIYEIMDAFDIDITVDKVPSPTVFDDYVELLKNLHSLSMHRPILSTSPSQRNGQSDTSQESYSYSYTDSLARLSGHSQSKKIRVLHLLPGYGRSRIECRLEVQDLHHGIDEALSYVWGKREDQKCIWVDNKPFRITCNLYEILVALRRSSTTRTLWIDAICINQSDLDEKSHQVHLMGEIYSNAKIVVVWLSGRTPDLKPTHDPYDILAPLPPDFEKEGINQYDIVSILKWVHQLPRDSPIEDHLVALALVTHWLNIIMSFEWWERVWTIQEAVLSQNHPIFVLGEYQFSFGDIISAMNVMRRVISFNVKLADIPPGM